MKTNFNRETLETAAEHVVRFPALEEQ